MALDTYTGLVDAIADWLNRRDLAARVPDFLQLAEDDINTRLRDRRMETSVVATVSGQPLPLPDDLIEIVRILGVASGQPIEPMTAHAIQELRASRRVYGVQIPPLPGGAYATRRYSITGGSLELYPAPVENFALDLVYLAKLPRLSVDTPTNWLLVEDPAIYLYGALAMAEPYLRNDERVTTWAGMYADRVQMRNAASTKSKFAGGPLHRRRRGFRS